MKQPGIFDKVRALESLVDRLSVSILDQGQRIRDLERGLRFRDAAPAMAEPGRRQIAQIAAEVAADNGLTLAELRSGTKAFEVSHPRQFAMMLMADYEHSHSAIGRYFGLDPSTVGHGVRAARARMAKAAE